MKILNKEKISQEIKMLEQSEGSKTNSGCICGMLLVLAPIILLLCTWNYVLPLISGVILLTLTVFFLLSSHFYRKKVEKLKQQLSEIEYAEKYYKKCVDFGIKDVNDKEQRKKLLTIAQSFGCKTEAEAIEKYFFGQKLIDKDKEIKENKELQKRKQKEFQLEEKINKIRRKEEEKYYDEINRSELTGKNGYIDIINKKIGKLQKEYDELNGVDPQAAFLKKKKDNWGWAGGIAEGIAGPAAGFMAAQAAHEENERYNQMVTDYNKALRLSGYDPYKIKEEIDKQKKSILTQIKNLHEYLEVIKCAVIDEENTDKNFEKLKFNIDNSINNDSGYMTLSITPEVLSPIKIYNVDGIIDGSIKINVLNDKNDVVGEAYYNGSSASTYKLSSAGFSNANSRKVIAVPIGRDCFDKNEEYHYEVHPIAIWIIESEKKEKNK